MKSNRFRKLATIPSPIKDCIGSVLFAERKAEVAEVPLHIFLNFHSFPFTQFSPSLPPPLFPLQTSANRKQVESLAKKKLDSLMKESQIRDREDPDSFTIAGLPPTGKPTTDQGSPKVGHVICACTAHTCFRDRLICLCFFPK